MTSSILTKSEAAGDGPAESVLDINGLRVRCRAAGEGPPVVRLGGFEDTRVEPFLTEAHQVVTLDPPDAGDNSATADTMIKAVAVLGIDRFSLMAHAQKSDLALRIAAQASDALNALVLTSPTVLGTGLATRNTGAEAEAAKLSVPVLALFGTRDTVVLAEMARVYSGAIPKCFTTLVYNATHAMNQERPEAIVAIVREFLVHREAFLVNRASGLLHP